jgi:hypothetical protein
MLFGARVNPVLSGSGASGQCVSRLQVAPGTLAPGETACKLESMAPTAALRVSFLPLLMLTGGQTTTCALSTDSSTGELHIIGIVRYMETQGGCWQVAANDGRQYELDAHQAPSSVLHDGAQVALVVYVRHSHSSGCQVGTPVEVWRVVEVDDPRA